jgi:hypothetical protein
MFASTLLSGIRMIMSQHRTGKRIPMELPAEIRWKSRAGNLKQAVGKTGNISGSGLFIEVAAHLRRATSVMIKVKLPPEVTKVPLELFCKGRVVRWDRHGQVEGVGAVIDEYELRPLTRTESGGKRSSKETD